MAETYAPIRGPVDGSAEDDSMVEPPAQSMFANDCDAMKGIVCQSINVLLVFVPIGYMSKSWGLSSVTIFSTNFIAIVPLAGILGASTESLAEHTGETIGGLVNASFGNAVEMIITIDAIKKGLCGVVQAGLIGSVLSNLLLVLGMAFMASGLVRSDTEFNAAGAGANSSLLLMAAIGVTMPTMFHSNESNSSEDTLAISRFCALVLASVYAFFLYFQLKTHKHHFEEHPVRISRVSSNLEEMQNDEGDQMQALSAGTATVTLFAVTLIISQLSELLVGSIEEVSEDYGVPKAFIGLILLPIVGNAAEHMTAVVSAYKGKMDLALGVAVGSSTQVALLIVPFAIIVGWAYDQPMDLNFGTFYSGIFLLAVFLVSNVLNDGSSNWLEGLMLIGMYVMIAVICWFIPNHEEEGLH